MSERTSDDENERLPEDGGRQDETDAEPDEEDDSKES